MIRSYVADVLVDEGYRVGTAQDGAVALQMLEAYQQQGLPQPAVILLDMRMPVMDGWAFSRAYRDLRVQHAPIVVVTAAHDAEKRAEQVRAADVLSKPFELDDLIDVVARQAGRRAG
jgi:urea transport system substrate-binding protein